MVNVTIDGKQIEVREGITVLNAARSAGIEIPTLCDHPELTPYGGCRLCLVEVEGMRTLQSSCTLPVMNNMVVHTDTPKTRDARKFILNMLFSERNHFCPYCQVSGGDCELQNAAYHEGLTHWNLQPNWKPYPVDASHPYIILEHNRCILCRRCVRACGELVGNFTLGFEERGASSSLVADLGVPLGESTCVGCGTCVQVCPTGALIERWSAYQGRETEVEHHQTICVGCSLVCGIDVLVRDNRLVRIEGDWNAPVNQGIICEVGRFHPMSEDREKLLTPLVRKNGSLKAATWDEALSVAAEQLTKKNNKSAALVSTRLPLEALDALQQLCRGLGMKASSLEEGWKTQPSIKLAESLGASFESKLDALLNADAVLVLGEDITHDHQVISFFIKRLIPNGCKVVTLNEQIDGLDNFATTNLKAKASTHAEIINALLNSLKTEQSNFSAIAKSSGVPIEELKKVTQLVKSAKKMVVVVGNAEDNPNGTNLLEAAYFLTKQTGASLLNLKGGANSLAASLLDLDMPINLDGVEVCLLAIGDERLSQQSIQQFQKVPFPIVLSSYVSLLTANAQVVFPVQNWLEQSGTYVNFSGQTQKANSSVNPAEGVLSSYEVFTRLAEKANIKLDEDWKSRLAKHVSPVTIEQLI